MAVMCQISFTVNYKTFSLLVNLLRPVLMKLASVLVYGSFGKKIGSK